MLSAVLKVTQILIQSIGIMILQNNGSIYYYRTEF